MKNNFQKIKIFAGAIFLCAIFLLPANAFAIEVSNIKAVESLDEYKLIEKDNNFVLSKDSKFIYFVFNVNQAKSGTKIGLEIKGAGNEVLLDNQTDALNLNQEDINTLKNDPTAYIYLEKPEKGWQTGSYEAAILVNGEEKGTVKFSVGEIKKIDTTPLYVLAVFFAFIPSFFWLWFYRRKDKAEPEPRKFIAKLFILGALGAIPIGIFEAVADSSFGLDLKDVSLGAGVSSAVLLLYFFLLVGPIEEFGKYLIGRVSVWHSKNFTQEIDGVIYMVTVSLGFALVENFMYFVALISNADKISKTFAQTGEADLAGAALSIALVMLFAIRFLLPTLMHTLASGIVGYYMGEARFREAGRGKLIATGLVIAILAHGFFNYTISTGGWILSALLLIGLMIFLFSKLRKKQTVLIHKPVDEFDPSKPVYAEDEPLEKISPADGGGKVKIKSLDRDSWEKFNDTKNKKDVLDEGKTHGFSVWQPPGGTKNDGEEDSQEGR